MVVVICVAPQFVHGWSAGGHKVIASIAYDRLDADIRGRVVKTLRAHEDFEARFAMRMPEALRKGDVADQDRWIFMQASVWPDLIRSNPKYDHPTWHYINVPLFLSPLDKTALQDTIKPNLNMDTPDEMESDKMGKLNCVQAFKHCVAQLSNPKVPAEAKAIYYCWILHIGGDIHQPCHSTSLISRGRFNGSEGDRGGNGIKIKQGSNLHSYWDGLLGGDQPLTALRGRAKEALDSAENIRAAEKAIEKLSIEDWVKESHALAKEQVYCKAILDEVTAREADSMKPLQKVDLPAEYRQEAGKLALRRVAEAGYRLAETIKKVAK
jgi:hypothetical protein